MRTDPRLRQTWNEISQNLETANQNAQANIFTFSQRYLDPCVSSVSASIDTCFGSCFPDRDERVRRYRASRRRGRMENNFDFYDDWEYDDGSGDALVGWSSDELDRLLAGSAAGTHAPQAQQPGRQRAMSYGARRDRDGRGAENVQDPTVIPTQSVFGFLSRLPWKVGRELRYKPSAADLQDRPFKGQDDALEEPLLDEEGGIGSSGKRRKHGRDRSVTSASETTTDSFRSRGDLIPSEDEDDAVPLDDEFAMVLERRTTGSGADGDSNRKAKKKKKRRSTRSQRSTKTDSSKETPISPGTGDEELSAPEDAISDTEARSLEVPSIHELQKEEESIQREEELAIQRRREAARNLAWDKGLSDDKGGLKDQNQVEVPEDQPDATDSTQPQQDHDTQTLKSKSSS